MHVKMAFRDITKVGEPVLIAGAFVHRRQRKLTFSVFKMLVELAFAKTSALEPNRPLEDLNNIPLFCTDGCGVLGPVLEAWFLKAYHGVVHVSDLANSPSQNVTCAVMV
jgi:hypothetical protein